MKIKVKLKAQDKKQDFDQFVFDQYIFLVEMEVKPYEDLDYQFDDEYQMPFDESVEISYPALSFKDALKMFIKDLNSGEVIGTESPFSYKFKPSDFMSITITKNKKEIKSLIGNIDDLEEVLRIQTKKHYRLIQKKAQDNKIYSGKEVSDYFRDITEIDESITKIGLENLIKNYVMENKWELKSIAISEVLKDPDFEQFWNNVDSEEDLYEDYYDRNFDDWELNQPIILYQKDNKTFLVDGYHRTAQRLLNEESNIKAYVVTEKE